MTRQLLTIVICLTVMTSFVVTSNSRRTLPEILKRTKDNQNKFESQGMYHSTYLTLNSDTSFVYYSVYEVGYDLTIGKYYQTDHTILLIWDSLLTNIAVIDSTIYKKYFRYSSPLPFKIDSMIYRINYDLLELVDK